MVTSSTPAFTLYFRNEGNQNKKYIQLPFSNASACVSVANVGTQETLNCIRVYSVLRISFFFFSSLNHVYQRNLTLPPGAVSILTVAISMFPFHSVASCLQFL